MGSEQGATPAGVTQLLHEARAGDAWALDRVLVLIYDDLRRLARSRLKREFGARTLQPTALVHEAYLKLSAGAGVDANDREHFLALAAHAMRQVLIDHARRRQSAKRGSGVAMVTLTGVDAAGERTLGPEELLALDAALDGLEPRQRQVVECRFFAGMADEEIGVALGVTDRTVRREWVKARAWLNRALYGPSPAPAR